MLRLLEPCKGLEPPTYGLQNRRSTDWANKASDPSTTEDTPIEEEPGKPWNLWALQGLNLRPSDYESATLYHWVKGP